MANTPLTVKLDGPGPVIEAVPLTREAFSQFGDVIENPRPDLHPSVASAPTASGVLPFDGISANQGSAIKYQHVSRQINLYSQAPSGVPGVSVMNMFICAARVRIPSSPSSPPSPESDAEAGPTTTTTAAAATFPVRVLERHPFTTQTFLPLTADSDKNYLVIVAPTLPPSADDQGLPVPVDLSSYPAGSDYPRPLPGRGLPDLNGLRAFVATGKQAVTYGAGTWHAPMVGLGETGTALDFLVVQFANGVAVEDCQEVYFSSSSKGEVERRGEERITVRLSSRSKPVVPPAAGSAGGGSRLTRL
ncbi:ureidoglycolate hydrolase [Podospora australis]|uniref:Ureidoglycolate hydrolase n=1 Tax=Podospora australis TaxID=1536484 RepID=A0AAN6WZG2_9PEZI|nr:ureidoglycolate hydrolase [Podospora australis]